MSKSVNQATIAHFTKDAPDWWNENGKFKPLHQLNPVRMQFITQAIQNHFGHTNYAKLNILDCGCGGGLTSEPLARLGAQVTGIDADPVAIAVAQNHAKNMKLNIDYRQSSIENLAAKKQKFDVVLALEIIEHVHDVESFVESLASVLKPDGLLILSTLNRTPKSRLQAITLAENILGWVPRGTHNWDQFFTPEEIADLLKPYKLQVRDKSGILFNPLTRQWHLGEDLDVNYILCATMK